MKKPVCYSSAYPGSMYSNEHGEYVKRDDIPSLLAALAEALAERDRQIADLQQAKEAA